MESEAKVETEPEVEDQPEQVGEQERDDDDNGAAWYLEYSHDRITIMVE